MNEESPAELLDEVARLRRDTRARVRGAWMPLTVFGLLTLTSALLYEMPFWTPPSGGYHLQYQVHGYSGLRWADRSLTLSIVFWMVVAPLCYLGCARWYARRAERVGLTMRWRAWNYTGMALLAAVGLAMWGRFLIPESLLHPASEAQPGEILSPLLAVTLGLVSLARAERSWGVAVVAVLYGTLSSVMNVYGLSVIPSWTTAGGSFDPLTSVGPNLILLSSVLFIGAGVLRLGRRRNVRMAAGAAPEAA